MIQLLHDFRFTIFFLIQSLYIQDTFSLWIMCLSNGTHDLPISRDYQRKWVQLSRLMDKLLSKWCLMFSCIYSHHSIQFLWNFSNSPLQSPHDVRHFNPCLYQEHVLLSHIMLLTYMAVIQVNRTANYPTILTKAD